MKRRVLIFSAILAFGGVASSGGWSANDALGAASDESCLWGAPGARTTYLPPFDPSDAPTIPLLKRSESEIGVGTGVAEKKDGVASVGPRVGDSGTFVGSDGKTYYYRFVEGVRRRAVVETRRVLETPPGATRPIWVERKALRYVDEPRLIKQIWPAEASPSTPVPCAPVGASETTAANGTDGANGATASDVPVYRASVRKIIP